MTLSDCNTTTPSILGMFLTQLQLHSNNNRIEGVQSPNSGDRLPTNACVSCHYWNDDGMVNAWAVRSTDHLIPLLFYVRKESRRSDTDTRTQNHLAYSKLRSRGDADQLGNM